jgi:cytochrome c
MKKSLLSLLFALCTIGLSQTGQAAPRGNADEAMALVKKAVAFVKANGKEKALAEFNNPKGQFVDRDLYIFSLDQAGVTLANGNNAKLIGKNVMAMKDQDGKPFIKNIYDLAASPGKGWVDYRWVNPVSGAIENKSTYVEKADDLIIGCGIYK